MDEYKNFGEKLAATRAACEALVKTLPEFAAAFDELAKADDRAARKLTVNVKSVEMQANVLMKDLRFMVWNVEFEGERAAKRRLAMTLKDASSHTSMLQQAVLNLNKKLQETSRQSECKPDAMRELANMAVQVSGWSGELAERLNGAINDKPAAEWPAV